MCQETHESGRRNAQELVRHAAQPKPDELRADEEEQPTKRSEVRVVVQGLDGDDLARVGRVGARAGENGDLVIERR